MKTLPEDIIEEMKIRFQGDFDQALHMLHDYLNKVDALNNDRVIRCVIYLTKNGITPLKKNLEAASQDPRDVLFWAEYENHDAAFPNRMRDFDKTFKENE